MKIKKPNAKSVVLAFLFVFATAFSPFVGDDQRNFLVIFISFLAVPLIYLFRLKVGQDLVWVTLALVYLILVVIFTGEYGSWSTVGYTAMFAMAYLVVAGGLRSGQIGSESILKLLKLIIYLFAIVATLQMVASFAGLPIPNGMLSHGMWSYNSLAVEPSHAGRALAMTMLVYLLLAQLTRQADSPMALLKQHRAVLSAFLLSIGLSGSALAAFCAPLVILLSLSKRWVLFLAIVLLAIWPTLLLIDSEPVRRVLDFMIALPSMDIQTVVEADQSGAIRVMPLLIYLDKVTIAEPAFWLGGGFDEIRRYVQGELIGAGDAVMAGFIPGYLMAFGIFGTAIFMWSFLFRFITKITFPVVVLWLLIFTTSAWNTQLFWYGLMLLRVTHHFTYFRASARTSAQTFVGSRITSGLVRGPIV